jgi:hypothetical protein
MARSVSRGFPLLAEVLVIGAMTTFAALGVVTAFGAIAAGCASLREYLDHDTAPGPRRYLTLLRTASRGAIPLLALPVLIVVVAADLLAWRAAMPGGRIVGPAALAVALAATVVALRAAASWQPVPDPDAPDRPQSRPRSQAQPQHQSQPQPWSALLSDAAAEALADWRGSLLIAGALAACAVLAFEIPALTLILPGLLTFAAVAVRQAATDSRGCRRR